MMDHRTLKKRNMMFTNWSKTFSCIPKVYAIPETELELIKLLKYATKQMMKVKVVGCGHSPSDIACTQSIMIDLRNFKQLLEVDEENMLVTVEAGMTLKELNELHLPKYNLALSVLGSVSEITVGGAISTGTHGTGVRYGILSTYVTDMVIITATGEKVHCCAATDNDVFLASLCSLGSFGVILRVTLRCEKAFNLVNNQYSTELKNVIEHLNVHLYSSDHFQFLWFPHTDNVVVSHKFRTNLPITKKFFWQKMNSWFWDYLIGYYILEFCYYVSTFFPWLVPAINSVFHHLLFSKSRRYVGVSYKVFNFECLFKQYVTEWAIDKSKTGQVLYKLREWIEQNPDVYVHFPVEVRFAKADKILISPCFERDTCFINIVMYRPYGNTVPYQKYWSAYEKILEEAGGRPHWAKAHCITADKFSMMYPRFVLWNNIRKRMDPLNMFFNNYMERIFLN